MTTSITAAQQRVLDFLRSHHAEKGYMPTRKEIVRHFGWKSVNAAEGHMAALERDGFIEVDRGTARAIRLTAAARSTGLAGLPQLSVEAMIPLPVIDPVRVGRTWLAESRGRAA